MSKVRHEPYTTQRPFRRKDSSASVSSMTSQGSNYSNIQSPMANEPADNISNRGSGSCLETVKASRPVLENTDQRLSQSVSGPGEFNVKQEPGLEYETMQDGDSSHSYRSAQGSENRTPETRESSMPHQETVNRKYRDKLLYFVLFLFSGKF